MAHVVYWDQKKGHRIVLPVTGGQYVAQILVGSRWQTASVRAALRIFRDAFDARLADLVAACFEADVAFGDPNPGSGWATRTARGLVDNLCRDFHELLRRRPH